MESEKVYYSIKEVKELTDLSSATLRYWEIQFSELNSRKDERGNRYYTIDDINLIRQIKFFRDELGITRISTIKSLLGEMPCSIKML